MKTLINKNNPQIRITAPEIGSYEGFYTLSDKDSHYLFKMETWALIENGELSIEGLPWSDEEPVDLEKFTEKIKTFQGKYKHPEIVSIKGAMAFMARMFYQYPNVARQWYEQLPKATMD